MPTRLAFIHTVEALDRTFRDMATSRLPDVEVDATVRPDLLADTIDRGHLSVRTIDEVDRLVRDAARDHDVVMVTCSTLGPAVDAVAPHLDVPILRVDAAMAEAAVAEHDRIGVLATLSSTLEPTTRLLERTARRLQRTPRVEPVLCDGAFEAARAGRGDDHDRQVADAARDLARRVDVIVLAQASMARALDTGLEVDVPVLTSPGLAMDALGRTIA